MSFREIIYAILLNIKENKIRVFLTSLGIIVGTFTIIMVVGIGIATTEAINEQYSDLSAETIMIRGARGRGQSSSVNLNIEDAEALKIINNIKDVAVSISSNETAIYNTSQLSTSIVGVNSSYMDINNLDNILGNSFTEQDNKARKKIAIIGYTAATELFGDDVEASIGKKIKIKGKNYEVIDVVEETGNTNGFSSVDNLIYVPYNTALNYIVKSENISINAQATSVNVVEQAIKEIEDLLEERKGDISNVMISDAGKQLEAAKESGKTMSSLLIAVSIIVLIVAGIGIMNVLLVSVKERTKEIGILKSIGATKRDIMSQFLIEAVTISLGGGIVGALLSLILYPLMKYTSLKFTPSIEGIILGIIFSAITGTFFGYYPAKKAAELKPIDALNYE